MGWGCAARIGRVADQCAPCDSDMDPALRGGARCPRRWGSNQTCIYILCMVAPLPARAVWLGWPSPTPVCPALTLSAGASMAATPSFFGVCAPRPTSPSQSKGSCTAHGRRSALRCPGPTMPHAPNPCVRLRRPRGRHPSLPGRLHHAPLPVQRRHPRPGWQDHCRVCVDRRYHAGGPPRAASPLCRRPLRVQASSGRANEAVPSVGPAPAALWPVARAVARASG